MRAIVMLIGFAACSFDPRGVGGGPDAGRDGRQDATPPDAASPEAGCTSFASQADTCSEAFGGPLVLDSPDSRYEYQDGVITVMDSDGESTGTITPVPRRTVNGIDLVFVSSFTLGATNRLRVRGTQPFGIVSLGTITIDGDVLAESGARGASACGSSNGVDGDNDGNGGGGGGGGGFQRAGFTGGDGAASGGAGGTSVTLATVIGGCAGGRGGDGDGNGGDPGVGGGAIYMASGVSIEVGLTGSIDAAGDGGRGGAGDGNGGRAGGGGGGGSGGLIWLEAASLTIRGALGANGGSGGEGAGSGGNSSGGGDGVRGLLATTAAPGASGEQQGGDGGDGGALIDATSGSNGSGGGGGGGGGGSVGFIRLAAPSRELGGAVISPVSIQ